MIVNKPNICLVQQPLARHLCSNFLCLEADLIFCLQANISFTLTGCESIASVILIQSILAIRSTLDYLGYKVPSVIYLIDGR